MASWYQQDRRCGRREEFAGLVRCWPGLEEQISHLLSSCSLGNSQRDTKNGICTELSLVWSSIKLDQEIVNLGLVLNVNVLLDERWANDVVDVCNSLENTLSSPLGLVTVAELDCLVLTCRLSQISSYLSQIREFEATNLWKRRMAQ